MSTSTTKSYIRFKRILTTITQPPNIINQYWSKKSFHIQLPNKQLRQTQSTLASTPKNTKILSPNQFTYLKFLGYGKFGSVYLVRHIETQTIFAMKVINKSQVKSDTKQQTSKMLNQLIRQIKIQMFIEHPNLIKLYTFFSDQYKIYLLMELACDGHLYQYMKNGHQFSEQSVSFIIRQTLKGINYLHQHHVIHRDIKPQNIVLIHGIPKFCDFGWSVHCPMEFRSTLCGTPLYLSPQILKGGAYNQKIDIWAIGTLTYQLLTGENPFKIRKRSEISKIITEHFTMQSGSSNSKDFLYSALQKDPQNRITSKMMLNHPFILKYIQIQTCEQLCNLISKKNNPKIQIKNL